MLPSRTTRVRVLDRARLPLLGALAIAFALTACGRKEPQPNASQPGRANGAAVLPEITTKVPEAVVTSSSFLDQLNATGLLQAREPGWHSRTPPVFPEWITVEFMQPQRFSGLSLLPQDGLIERAPKKVRIETSATDGSWAPVTTIEDSCTPQNQWHTFRFGSTVETTKLRLTILSNCGYLNLVTLRGLRLEP